MEGARRAHSEAACLAWHLWSAMCHSRCSACRGPFPRRRNLRPPPRLLDRRFDRCFERRLTAWHAPGAQVRQFANPIVIFHPRGHVIPNLQGAPLAVLRAFLSSVAQQPAGGAGAGGGGGSRVGALAPPLSKL